MPVFVDNARIRYRNMRMSHLVADTALELRDMARQLGLPLKHIQKAGTASEHLDVSDAYRKKAIELGAHPVSSYEIVAIILRKRAAR